MMKSFLSLFILFVFTVCSSLAQETINLDPNGFQKAIASEGIQLLDVRRMEEYQSGHLKDALLADWTAAREEFKRRVASLDKSKPVYVYCLVGGRSSAAAQYLKENGFVTYNLTGGIAKWKQEGKPVEAVVEVKQTTYQEFQSMINSGKVVLVDVTASWCPPCKKMKPVIDSLAGNNKTFKLVTIDGGAQTELVEKLAVKAFPTFIIYKNGRESSRLTGIVEGAVLAKHL